MSCRYPGGVHSPEELWQLVAAGDDAIAEFPDDRGWDLDALYDPDPDQPGTSYTRDGGFLYDAARVRRGVLRRSRRARRWRWTRSSGCCWRPPGRRSSGPGIDPASLRGSQTGVFVGVNDQDYGD